MRPGLLVVLALWVSCISTRGWGKQEIREQGLEQSTLLPQWIIPLSKAINAMPYVHDGLRKIKDHLALDVIGYVRKWRFSESRPGVHVSSLSRGHASPLDRSDVVAVKKISLAQDEAMLPWLHSRHISMSPRAVSWLGKDNVVVDDSKEQDTGHKEHISLHVKHAKHILSHDNAWSAMHRVSLLDVIDESATDKQANVVRRQGVDSALLRYAGLILSSDTLTGAVYDVGLPPSLAGIHSQVTRIIPDTLKQASLVLNEFTIPMGASFSPSGDYIALVYRKISSFTVYTLPPEYQFGGPVVGIMSSSSNSTAIDPSLPPGSISLPANTYINITLPMFSTSLAGNAFCAFFALNGSIFVSNLASMPSYCFSSTLGDFALIVEASSTSPTQGMSPPTAVDSPKDGSMHSSSSPSAKSSSNWKLILGATCLALAGLAFLVAVALIGIKLTESVKHFLATCHYTGNDEALQDSLVGGSIAPSAAVIRTKPALEIDVAHFSH